MRVYWIRHGETDFNRQRIVQGGGIDSALNEIGHTQSSALFEAYQTVPIDAFYTSALQRTQHTFAPWQKKGHILTPVSDLNELGWGDLEGQPSSEHTRALFGRILDAWSAGDHEARMPNGESVLDASARVQAFIKRLEAHPPHHTIFVCTHGRLLRIILSQIVGGGLHTMEDFPNDNTAVNLTHYSPEKGWTAERLNCTAHLQARGVETFTAPYR